MPATYFYTTGKLGTYAALRALLMGGQCAVVCAAAVTESVEVCLYAVAIWQAAFALGVLGHIVARHGWAAPSVSGFPGLWRFAAWMMVDHWVFFSANRGGQYVVVGLLGLEVAAVFILAFQFATLVSMVGTPNQFVLLPMMSAHWNAGQQERARPLVRLAYLIVALFGFTAVAVLQQLGPYLTTLLSTTSFLPPPSLLLILAIGFLATCFFNVSRMAFSMTRRFAKFQTVGAVGALLNIGLPFLLIPTLGIIGAGIAFCTASVVVAAVVYRMSVRVLGVGLDWTRTIKAAVLGLFVYGAMMPLHWAPWGDLGKVLAGAGLAVAAGVAGFFLLRFYRLDEIREILRRLSARPRVAVER